MSVNDFIVRAAALALQEVPGANAFWDGKAEQVRASPGVDVAVAVATDKGLITPIVKAANTKSLVQVGGPRCACHSLGTGQGKQGLRSAQCRCSFPGKVFWGPVY